MSKFPRSVVWCVAGLAGVLLGFAAQRWSQARKAAAPMVAEAPGLPATKRRGTAAVAGAADPAALAEVVALKSSDTLDDLLGLDDFELYGRLALWSLDAPVGELARFWAAYQARRAEPEMWVSDLLFTRWTRLDPEGAVRAAGDKAKGIVWWAWAINDPEAALARVVELAPEQAGFVVRAIGQFHPERSARVLAEHPELAGWNGIDGIASGMAREDPEGALEFLRRHGQGYDTRVFREWLRDDPRAAFEWAGKQLRGNQHDFRMRCLVETLERENPEALRELAAAQPAGRLRRQMEDALFRNMLESDPGAALQQARATESPRVAAQRLAEVGRRVLVKDPERAFTTFAELLEKCPSATNHMIWTTYPNGSSSGGGGPLEGVGELADGLLGSDPGRLMETVAAAVPGAKVEWGSASSGPLGAMAERWAERDLDGYRAWLDGQAAGEGRDGLTYLALRQLQERKSYQEAAELAAGLGDRQRQFVMMQEIVRGWAGRDRAAAASWLQQAQLPEQWQRDLGQILERTEVAR